MKLSEAILLGSLNKPQGFGQLSVNPQAKRTCAIGAALDAMGINCIDASGAEYVYFRRIWPWTSDVARSPISDAFSVTTKGQYCSITRLIWVMNDARMTREAIAQWVKTIEPQQEGGEHIEIFSNHLGWAANDSLQHAING